jgi:hypothetical protein
LRDAAVKIDQQLTASLERGQSKKRPNTSGHTESTRESGPRGRERYLQNC